MKMRGGRDEQVESEIGGGDEGGRGRETKDGGKEWAAGRDEGWRGTRRDIWKTRDREGKRTGEGCEVRGAREEYRIQVVAAIAVRVAPPLLYTRHDRTDGK
jgi:hypothetical protein